MTAFRVFGYTVHPTAVNPSPEQVSTYSRPHVHTRKYNGSRWRFARVFPDFSFDKFYD